MLKQYFENVETHIFSTSSSLVPARAGNSAGAPWCGGGDQGWQRAEARGGGHGAEAVWGVAGHGGGRGTASSMARRRSVGGVARHGGQGAASAMALRRPGAAAAGRGGGRALRRARRGGKVRGRRRGLSGGRHGKGYG